MGSKTIPKVWPSGKCAIQEPARTFLIPSAVRPRVLSQMAPTCNLSARLEWGQLAIPATSLRHATTGHGNARVGDGGCKRK